MQNNTADEKARGECKRKDANAASFFAFFVWLLFARRLGCDCHVVRPKRKNAGRMPFVPQDKPALPEKSGDGERLCFDLLCEQIAAEGDAAIESHCRKVGAAAKLAFGPGANRRSDAPADGLQKVDHAKVDPNGANLATILWAIGAEVQELNDTLKVFA